MCTTQLNPSMDTITFQDFLLKLSLHTSIIKNKSNYPNSNPSKKGIQKLQKKLEQNLPIVAKRFRNSIRVAYLMLRKNISKPKLLADLHTMMKRGKIAGKSAINNLMFHHNSDGAVSADDSQIPTDENEFSCGDTPAQPTSRLPFHLNKCKRIPSPPPPEQSDADLFAAAMEIAGDEATTEASPMLPGLGRTPRVRQLRITDSPFRLREIEEDDEVNEAAEKFIMKFYRDLQQQYTNTMPS